MVLARSWDSEIYKAIASENVSFSSCGIKSFQSKVKITCGSGDDADIQNKNLQQNQELNKFIFCR